VALRALLPATGRRLIEIGAGYGRLVDLYQGYDEVVLMDYARSQLRQAQKRLGETGPAGQPRYRYVQADFYRLPFVPGLFDTTVMVRTLHHAADAPAVLQGVAEILAPGGTFVLEFANKQNLKAILRYLLRRQAWSPFETQPVEFVELNFDFHPAWIRRQLAAVGLRIEETRTTSHLRIGFLKRTVPTGLLVALDRLFQPTGAWWQLTPSVFHRASAPVDKPPADPDAFFRCPVCRSMSIQEAEDHVACDACAARFPIREGIVDLREEVG
jgi:SAM-dependent methyltransferase